MIVNFDAERHEYSDEHGKIYPSVTQVLKAGGVFNGYAGISDEQRAAAMDLGTRVHWMLQLYDEGALNVRKLKKPMRGYLKAWRTWKQYSGFIVAGIEQRFISPLGYAGTVDRHGYIMHPHIPVMLDIKTGAIPDWVKIQLAAYVRGLFPDAPFVRRITFNPAADGTYKIKEHPPASLAVDFAKFTEALRRMNDNGSRT